MMTCLKDAATISGKPPSARNAHIGANRTHEDFDAIRECRNATLSVRPGRSSRLCRSSMHTGRMLPQGDGASY